MSHEPLYLVPILIEQPTWGGQYISQFKNLESSELTKNNIGQSYELAQESLVYSGDFSRCYQYAKTSNLADLINIDVPQQAVPLKTVAPQAAAILIKFTQAQENSYQVHVKPADASDPAHPLASWQPKPESWYFFEEGCATLGLKNPTNLAPYKQRCEEINAFAQNLSTKVSAQELTVAQAREKLAKFIDTDHPRNYVHTVRIPKNHVVELSQGGVHHSWEAHPDLPLGNIVYEVQKDVKDDVSTLRSFDQGKMKDDGSIRPLTINEYFTALDVTVDNNTPANLMNSTETGSDERSLFDTPYYKLEQLDFAGGSAAEPDTKQLAVSQYSHVFTKEGEVTITHPDFADKNWILPQGWSVLLAPNPKPYLISASVPASQVNDTNHKTSVLITK